MNVSHVSEETGLNLPCTTLGRQSGTSTTWDLQALLCSGKNTVCRARQTRPLIRSIIFGALINVPHGKEHMSV